MAKNSFQWGKDGSRPDLQSHSATKLEVLRDYVIDYLKILVQGTMGKEVFKITFVDAFAGGGKYSKGEDGSPLVLLGAVRDAEAAINSSQKRKKPLKIEAHYYFIERNLKNFSALKGSILESEWREAIGGSIFLYNESFENVAQQIVSRTKHRHPKGGSRVIFFLDQCGWSQVSAKLIAELSESLNYKSEFILNFACEWLATYMNEGEQFAKTYDGLGLNDLIPINQLIKIKEDHQWDYRYIIASQLGPALKAATQSEFFSPFYIEPDNGGNHGYWLVHLAPHMRARNAMMDVYYDKQTHIRAFGNTGLNMFAYKPDHSDSGYLNGFELNSTTRGHAINHMSKEIIEEFRLAYPNGVSFEQYCSDKINDTVANVSLLGDAIVNLAKLGELDILGSGGGSKRTTNIIASDQILINPKPFLPLFNIPRNGKLSG